MGISFIFRQTGRDSMYKTWHASRDHLFMYVYSGEGAAVCSEGAFTIKPGSLLFICAGCYHYTLPGDPSEYVRSKIIVSPDKFSSLLSLIDDASLREVFSRKSFVCTLIPEREREGVEKLFSSLSGCAGRAGELALLSGLMKLMYLAATFRADSLPSASGITAEAVAHINKNICSDLDVGSICRAVGVSKYHFCREFKKNTGLTVMEYVLKTRLVLAKNELEKSDLSVSQISEKCGFSSVSYFCRVFKKEEGVSPLRFRVLSAPSPPDPARRSEK
ncbi:MAG: AraC family transcriptional regulator [Clostridia bacterium]|nr:AraC family transcriptional regulator [Clostridia bacterium]